MCRAALCLACMIFALGAYAHGAAPAWRAAQEQRSYVQEQSQTRILEDAQQRWLRRQVRSNNSKEISSLQYDHSIAKRCEDKFPANTKTLLRCMQRLAGRG